MSLVEGKSQSWLGLLASHPHTCKFAHRIHDRGRNAFRKTFMIPSGILMGATGLTEVQPEMQLLQTQGIDAKNWEAQWRSHQRGDLQKVNAERKHFARPQKRSPARRRVRRPLCLPCQCPRSRPARRICRQQRRQQNPFCHCFCRPQIRNRPPDHQKRSKIVQVPLKWKASGFPALHDSGLP